MANISRVTTWSDGQTLTASALNGEFNNILNDYNGNITDANISASAAISLSKLASTPATLTGSETLTNKTLGSGTKVGIGSDAQGDVYFNGGSGTLTRLAPGTSGQFLQTQGASANPIWATVKGVQSIQQTTTLTNSSTSSTSDVTMLSLTFTPSATANILVMVNFIWQQSNASGTNYADLQLDSVVQGNNPMVQEDFTASGKNKGASFHYYLSNVSNASHTISVGFRVGSGATTGTVASAVLTAVVFNA